MLSNRTCAGTRCVEYREIACAKGAVLVLNLTSSFLCAVRRSGEWARNTARHYGTEGLSTLKTQRHGGTERDIIKRVSGGASCGVSSSSSVRSSSLFLPYLPRIPYLFNSPTTRSGGW